MPDTAHIVAGFDTHADTHHVAVVSMAGVKIADMRVPATPTGYRQARQFIASHGDLVRVGVEGTNSYGAGLSRFLRRCGDTVVEVLRPKRHVRRTRGKTDPIDAYEAAKAALNGDAQAVPKHADSTVEQIRVLLIARESAIKAASAAMAQIKSVIVTCPDTLRARWASLTNQQLITTLSGLRPRPATNSVGTACHPALRCLARRWTLLHMEADALEADLDILTRRTNPGLASAPGVGPITAAQLLVTADDNPERVNSEASFALLTGTAPLPASSGKTNRHRLNRGGDRRANAAIHQIALVRMSKDPRTKAYIAKLKASGKTTREAMRCLKRAIAREMFHRLVHPQPVPDVTDLRTNRLAAGLTLTDLADALGTCLSTISRLERGLTRNDTLANQHRQWVTNHPRTPTCTE
jgi:transposase